MNFRLALLLLLPCFAAAQPVPEAENRWPDCIFGADFQYGVIVPHTAQMSHLITGHSRSLSLHCLFQTDGSRPWHREYHLPRHGVRMFYNATGNEPRLGRQFALFYALDLRLNRASGNGWFRHGLMLGVGLGYSTRRWNLRENHQAPVLGSHLNMALSLRYQVQVASAGASQFVAGIDAVHLSNGAFKVPNLGTNNISLFVGARLSAKKPGPVLAQPNEQRFSPAWHFVATVSLGMKQIPPPGGRFYSTWNAGAGTYFHFAEKSALAAGVDLFYNTTLRTLLARRDNLTPSTADLLQAGIHGGYQLHISQFQVVIQQGIYIHDKWKDTGRLYHRFGLRYQWSRQGFVLLGLKTHFAKADYGEIGIGYRL
jgi:hypothetical protein